MTVSVRAKVTIPLGLLLLLVAAIEGMDEDENHEFCQIDDFKASCSPDEVVMMQDSLFGRMELGRCISKNYGFIGCKADVLNITDLLCSGRRSCSIPVPNELMDDTKPCPDDFKSYLWANYSCTKVVTPNTKTCYQPQTLTAPEGNLASVVTMETDCGSPSAPWIIEVGQGQRINITFMDFSYASNARADPNIIDSNCFVYANINEGNQRHTVKVCGRSKRISNEYLSVTNKVKVILLGGTHSPRSRYFMLSYKAVGCPDPEKPVGGWVKSDGGKIVVGCDGQSREWPLECQNDVLVGERPKCRGGIDSSDENGHNGHLLPAGRKEKTSVRLPYDVAIVLVTAIAGGIALIILCIGLMCVRRSRNNRAARTSAAQQMAAAHYGTQDFTSQDDGNYTRKERDLTWNYDQYKMSENEYASIQERSSPPPVGNKPSGMFTEHAHAHAHPKQLPDCRVQLPAPPYSCLEPTNENSMNQYTENNNSGGSRQYYVLDNVVVSPDS